jgi:hypothetical protein
MEEENQDDGNTLLPIQSLEVSNVRRKGEQNTSVVLWDAGSTLSFITFELAKKLQLNGEPVDLEIVTVGGEAKRVSSQKYTIVAWDKEDREVKFEVLGIEQISTEIETVEVNEIIHEFKSEVAKKAARPQGGNIDLLIGFQYAAYHPTKREELGHLLTMENRFGFTSLIVFSLRRGWDPAIINPKRFSMISK